MVKLISPAPGGWENLPFRSTQPPYSKNNRHRGKDWGYFYKDHTSRRVVAPVAGTVRISSANGAWNNGWGNRVEIVVNDRVYSALNHLDTGSIRVRNGQHVNAGDLIATMGATGDTSGQIHLHEELWIDGVRVDPDIYRVNDLPGTSPATTGKGNSTQPVTPEEEDTTMKHLFVRDSGGNLWTLVNTATGELVQTRSQADANTWAEAWGTAKVCSLQAFLNALNAVEITLRKSKTDLADLRALIDSIKTELA